MTAKTYYSVGYGMHVAKFSSFPEALRFAQDVSERRHLKSHLIEVRSARGLVGQYRNGIPTPEFAHAHHLQIKWKI